MPSTRWSRRARRRLRLPIDPGWHGRRAVQSSIALDSTRRWSTNFHCPTTPSLRRCSVLETAAIDFAWSTAPISPPPSRAGRTSASKIVEAALARIRARDPLLNSFTAVTEQRALARAQALDAGARARRTRYRPLAGVPFAVKNLFDIAGLPTLAGSKINRDAPPANARRDADRAARSRRRHPRRRAQHGRIRLRFHRREHPRRAVAQSARSRAHDRRLVRRLGRRGRRRARAARARLRHQRLDPRARLRCAACSGSSRPTGG